MPRVLRDTAELIREAQAKAGPIVGSLLASESGNGPSLTLLALHVARREVLRLARERIPEAQWGLFARDQAHLEAACDEFLKGVGSLNTELVKLARGT